MSLNNNEEIMKQTMKQTIMKYEMPPTTPVAKVIQKLETSPLDILSKEALRAIAHELFTYEFSAFVVNVYMDRGTRHKLYEDGVRQLMAYIQHSDRHERILSFVSFEVTR